MQEHLRCPHLPEVWALADGELDPTRVEAVEQHVAACRVCAEERRQLERLAAVLRAGEVTAAFAPQKRERLKQELLERCARSLAAAAPASGDARVSARAGLWARWVGLWQRVRFALPVARRLAPALAAIVVVMISLIFVGEVPAQTLEKVLNAMARVRSAHCVGWFVSYVDTHPKTGKPLPGRMRSEWWYRAPDKFRRDWGPEVRGWSVEPGSLIIDGQRGVLISQYHADRGHITEVKPSRIALYLSPMDFFSTEGLIGRAAREKRAAVSQTEARYQGHKVDVLSVEVVEPASTHRWVLYVARSSNLILRSERYLYSGKGPDRIPETKEILERFEYNVPVAADRFKVEQHPG